MSNEGRCTICEGHKAEPINAFLQAGRAPYWIEGKMRELGAPTKAETIKKHLTICLSGDPARASLLGETAGNGKPPPNLNADFAQAIREEANKRLAAGDLRVTAAHGLQAQALIDRRIEKQADRALMVQLAALLTGGSMNPPEDLIEGEWREVPDDALALT